MRQERTPNYVLTSRVEIGSGPHDTRVLEAGSFIRPIELQYVPQHVIEKNKFFNKDIEVFVYCRYGIIVVRKSLVRES